MNFETLTPEFPSPGVCSNTAHWSYISVTISNVNIYMYLSVFRSIMTVIDVNFVSITAHAQCNRIKSPIELKLYFVCSDWLFFTVYRDYK